MSDSAFKSAPFPGYTLPQLRAMVGTVRDATTAALMEGEIARREKRDAGDVSVMTAGERLRHVKA